MNHLHQAFLRAVQRAFADLPEERIEALRTDDAWLGRVIRETLDDVVKYVSAELRDTRAGMLNQWRLDLGRFEEDHFARWATMIDAIETLIVIALKAGGDFNKECRPEAFATGSYRLIALTSLHARSCQIAQEILVLLKSGFADGAHARWRSLHELAVVGFVLAQEGDDLSEGFMLHQQVEAYRAMVEYQSYAERLGQSPYSEEELEISQRRREEVVQRYGESFKEPHGWASGILGKKKPTFADLERQVNLDHFRPYYRMASYNVHAGPRGAAFRLGQRDASEVLLAGPSMYGLADPGHGTAISLYHCTVALLTIEPNVDRLVTLRIMADLVQEIGEKAATINTQMATQTQSTDRTDGKRQERGERPMPIAHAKPVYYELVIIATAPTTEIWLGDADGHFVQKEIGTLETNLLPGEYTVEFGLGTLLYPIHLAQASRYTQETLATGPTCPRPILKLAPE